MRLWLSFRTVTLAWRDAESNIFVENMVFLSRSQVKSGMTNFFGRCLII